MEQQLAQLTQTVVNDVGHLVTTHVMRLLTDHVQKFATELAALSNGTVTSSQVMELWNRTAKNHQVPQTSQAPQTSQVGQQASQQKVSPVRESAIGGGGGCTFVITRGERKNQTCGSKVSGDGVFCSRHKNSIKNGGKGRSKKKSQVKEPEEEVEVEEEVGEEEED